MFLNIKSVFRFFLFFFLFKNNSMLSALIITIPKSGTHLLFKVIENITSNPIFNPQDLNPSIIDFTLFDISEHNLFFLLSLNKEKILFSHLNYKISYSKLLDQEKTIVLFNIRDPRDQAVSHAHWQKDFPAFYPDAIALSFNKVLINIIKEIDAYYNIWLPWMDYPYALTVRFEDLVGSKGGGDDARQLAAIKDIAKHVSVELSEERAQQIATNLFGITKNTFRKGQIGAWKQEFTPEHKKLFKQYGGELLIKLGYEKDLNW